MGIVRVTTANQTHDVEYKDLGEHPVYVEDGPEYYAWMTDFTYRDRCIRSIVDSELVTHALTGVTAFRNVEVRAYLEALVYIFDKSPVRSIEVL